MQIQAVPLRADTPFVDFCSVCQHLLHRQAVGWQWLALVSPLFVYLLLTRISGIPLLERRADEKWEGDPDYWHYKAVTPVLWLRPPDASGPEKGLDP